MPYECIACKYKTNKSSNYTKHTEGTKHKKLIVAWEESKKLKQQVDQQILEHPKQINENTCEYCNKLFTHSKALIVHHKTCKDIKNMQNQYENKINELQLKYESEIKLKDSIIISMEKALVGKDETIASKDETIKILKDQFAQINAEFIYLKSNVNISVTILNKSVSTLQYLINNYKTSPPFKIMDDISSIQNNGGDYDNDAPDNNDPVTNNTLFVENLIFKYKHNLLVKYLGDYIIKKYKKNDPSQQSVWNSDVSRLSYIIRHKINDDNVEWRTDKKGKVTEQIAIDPLLQYIETSIIEFYASPNMQMNPKDTSYDTLHEKVGNVAEMQRYVQEKMISVDIIKYIAPHFYLTKDDNLMCIK